MDFTINGNEVIKMYKIAKIDFKPIINDRDIALDKIDDILWMLIKNGQILDECIVEKHNDHYIANVITTDDDSLDTKYFNQYKEDNFNSYINHLRIDYAILKLHSDSKFRKFSIDALALEFGFSKRRHFSDVFIKKTGITPSYYIQQLEKE